MLKKKIYITFHLIKLRVFFIINNFIDNTKFCFTSSYILVTYSPTIPIMNVFKENKNNISNIVKEKPSYGLRKNLLIKTNIEI